MKIAIFSDTFEQVNGIAIHVKGVAKELAKKHDVTVYTGRGSSNDFKLVNLNSCKPFFINGYEFFLPSFKKIECDVAHAHSPVMTKFDAFRTGKPVVTTTHAVPDHYFSSYGLNFLNSIGWSIIKKFHNKSDHVICQTNATAELFKSKGITKPISIVSSGIDFQRFNNADEKLFREKYNIDGKFVLSANRIDPEKRPDWILNACKELDIPIIFLADGIMRKKLEGKYSKAIFLGKMDSKFVASAFAASEIVLLTSTIETEGMVVNEALASRTPVISTNLPCISETIIDNENGFLFNNYNEFKQKLEILWNDRELRNKFSSNGIDKVKEKDFSVVAKKLENIYEGLLKK